MWIRQVDAERRELAMIQSLSAHIGGKLDKLLLLLPLFTLLLRLFLFLLLSTLPVVLQETGAVLGHDLGEELALWPDPQVKVGSLQLDVDQAGGRREETAGNDSLIACTYWMKLDTLLLLLPLFTLFLWLFLFFYQLFPSSCKETGAVLGHDLGEELALWPDPAVKLGSLQLDVDQAGGRREEGAGNDSLLACTYWMKVG